jgi:hypothetical protein
VQLVVDDQLWQHLQRIEDPKDYFIATVPIKSWFLNEELYKLLVSGSIDLLSLHLTEDLENEDVFIIAQGWNFFISFPIDRTPAFFVDKRNI